MTDTAGFAILPLTALRPSPNNPRQVQCDQALGELAESIKAHGVLEPLIVRPVAGNGHFEILAGERRFRAAELVGLVEVPVVVKQLDDDQALEVTLVENLQRDDFKPLEEAHGYRALIDSNPARYSAAAIAERIGKSERYVWDRMKLLDLIPEAQQLLERGLITAKHAILIARLKPETQKKIIEYDPIDNYRAGTEGLWREETSLLDVVDEYSDEGDEAEERDPYARVKACSVRELETWIARNVRFDAQHMAQAAPLDFGETALKIEAAAAKPGRGKNVVAITYEYRVSDLARDEHERTYGRESWKRADGSDEDSPTCEHSVLGVVAAGPNYGQAFEVCIAKDKCDVHWKAERREKERRQKAAAKSGRSGADQESGGSSKQESAWEKQQAREAAERAAWKLAAPALVQTLAAKVEKVKPAAVADLVLQKCDSYAGSLREATKLLGAAKTGDDIVRVAALAVLIGLAQDEWNGPRRLPKLAKPLGVDVAAILKAQAKHETSSDRIDQHQLGGHPRATPHRSGHQGGGDCRLGAAPRAARRGDCGHDAAGRAAGPAPEGRCGSPGAGQPDDARPEAAIGPGDVRRAQSRRHARRGCPAEGRHGVALGPGRQSRRRTGREPHHDPARAPGRRPPDDRRPCACRHLEPGAPDRAGEGGALTCRAVACGTTGIRRHWRRPGS